MVTRNNRGVAAHTTQNEAAVRSDSGSDVDRRSDLTDYLARIGFSGAIEPTRETLAGLVAHHQRRIPFENIDPLLGIPVDDLRPEKLLDKLVYRRRGGCCYESNGLMAYVLERIGFSVSALAGRPIWMDAAATSGRLTAESHQALAVGVPGVAGTFLIDVGFGGQSPSAPLHLETDRVQQTRHEPYRIRDLGDDLVLEALIRNTWQPLYTFADRPRPLIDMEVASWYISTCPKSFFVVGLSAGLITDNERILLRGRNLTVHRPEGTERIRLDSAADVIAALVSRFDINLEGLEDLSFRVSQILDN